MSTVAKMERLKGLNQERKEHIDEAGSVKCVVWVCQRIRNRPGRKDLGKMRHSRDSRRMERLQETEPEEWSS